MNSMEIKSKFDTPKNPTDMKIEQKHALPEQSVREKT